jgi:alginate O-acetyltransferase complex protein AlgI
MVQILVAWVFFRASSIGQAWDIVKIMFSFTGEFTLGWDFNVAIFISIIVLRELFVATGANDRINWNSRTGAWVEMVFYALLIAAVIYFRGNGSEFIYFQF